MWIDELSLAQQLCALPLASPTLTVTPSAPLADVVFDPPFEAANAVLCDYCDSTPYNTSLVSESFYFNFNSFNLGLRAYFGLIVLKSLGVQAVRGGQLLIPAPVELLGYANDRLISERERHAVPG